MEINKTIQLLISVVIGDCAVPLFYIISGFLFFHNVNQETIIYSKIKKRINTLFVPYIISCIFFTITITCISLIPNISQYINNSILPIYENQTLYILKKVFGFSINDIPLAFHLWFLRNLIVIIIFTPLLFILFKILNKYFILILIVLSLLFPNTIISKSLLWFCIGGHLAYYPIYIEKKNKKWITLFSIIVYLLISLEIKSFISINQYPILYLIGVFGIWNIYDYIILYKNSINRRNILNIAYKYTFFIYLYHEPIINVFRKIIVAIIGKNSLGYLTSYLLSPWITIITLILIGSFFKKYLTKIYYVCTGNR